MNYINQFFLSFISCVCFGIIFNVPRRTLATCGTIGALGWVSYWISFQFLHNVAIANFIGTLIIGVLCTFGSRRLKVPVIILNIPAIVPLVPGAASYMAIRTAVEGHYEESLNHFTNLLWTIGAIVVGFMFTKLIELEFSKHHQRKTVNDK